MLLTDVRKEVIGVLRSEYCTQARLSRIMGVTRQTINTYLSCERWVSPPLVKMMDVLGYDIEIEFVKRK